MQALKKDRNMKQTWMAAVEKERKKRPLPIKYIPWKSDMKYFNMKIYKNKINYPWASQPVQPIKWIMHTGYEYKIHSSNHSIQSSKHSVSQPHYTFLNQPSAAIQPLTKCTLKYQRYISLDYFKLYQMVYSNHLKALNYQSQIYLRSFSK